MGTGFILANFTIIDQMELLDYVHLKHPIVLNTDQHNKLKDFIKFKYRIEILINFDMVEFDIGYFNEKE